MLRNVVGADCSDWRSQHPKASIHALGYLPNFISDNDNRSAKEQIDDRYISGWHEFKGFDMNPETNALIYPGNPDYPPLWSRKLREETIILYQHSWVAIVQKDGSFEVARID
jgi:hypothetical protein